MATRKKSTKRERREQTFGSFVVELSTGQIGKFHDMKRAQDWAMSRLKGMVPGSWAAFTRAPVPGAKPGSSVGVPWTEPFYGLEVNEHGHVTSGLYQRFKQRRDPVRAKKSAKFERCVRKVKRSRSAVNPWAVCRASVGRDPILTDEHGRPIPKPRRSDFRSDAEFIRAFHAYKDRVASVANQAVPSPKKNPEVEREMQLGFLEAVWLDSYMSWADEHGLGYTTGHIPQHVQGLDDIPQAVPASAKKLARKYGSLLVKMNKASLTQLWERATRADGRSVDARALGFALAMQSRGHGISWTDDHETFQVLLPSAEWYAYGSKGRVQVEGYVSERFSHGL